MERKRFSLIVLVFLQTGTSAYGASCTAGTKVGYNPSPATWTVDPASTGDGYVMTDPGYWIGCCGKVSSLEFLPLSTGNIEFYVYSYNMGTSTYDVTGTYSTTVTPIEKDAVANKTLPDAEKFTAKEGDIVGWYTAGANIIAFDNTAVPVGKRATLTPPVTSFNWDLEQTATPGVAHIALYLEPSLAPYFLNDLVTTTVPDTSATVGYVVHTLVYKDDDDTTATLTVTMDTSSQYFELDPASGEVKVKSVPPTGSYNISFTVEDPCGNPDVQTLQIHITSDPPTITNLDGSITLAEDDKGNKELLALTVTDPTNDKYTCKIDTTNPVGAPVSLVVTNVLDYSIWLDSYPGLTAGTYDVFISCEDKSGATSTVGKYTITVTANNPPVWNDAVFPIGKNIDIKSKDIKTGSTIYTVEATDADLDDLTYEMTSVPADCPMQIMDNGQILATRSFLTDKIESCDLQISVSDGTNVVGPRTLKVTIDINHIPAFPSSAASVSVPETTAVGSVLYTLSATDIDLDSLQYSAKFTPLSGSELFELDYSTGNLQIKLKPGANIDFESVNDYSYVISIVANDGLEDSLPFELTLKITNENEKPYFEQVRYAINVNEGIQNGDAAFSFPSFWVRDPDYNDQLTFSLDSTCPLSAYATMEPTTGATSFKSHYDIDKTVLKSTTMNCIVTVTDSAGDTSITNLEIQVEDVNDNTPAFIDAPYSFTATNKSVAGTVVGKVKAEDLDLTNPNDEITYTTSEPCGVKEDGSVYLAIDLTGYAINSVLNCVVTATDGGDPRRSSTETVTITVVEIVTTTTSTTTQATTSSSSSFDAKLVWIPLLCLALLGLMGLGLYMAARFCKCCDGSCCRCCRPHHGKHHFKNELSTKNDKQDRAFYRTTSPARESGVLISMR